MNKKYFVTLLSVGLIYCLLGTPFLNILYFILVRHVSEYRLMGMAIVGAFVFLALYVLLQVLLPSNAKSGWRRTLLKVVSGSIALLVFYCSIVIVGLLENKELWHKFFTGQSTLKRSIHLALTAESLDIFLCFFLAFATRLPYLCIQQFYKREVVLAFFTWLFMIFLNEMVIQRFFFSDIRTAQVRDILNNICGVAFGLLLSQRWFLVEDRK